jgi:RNA polymerase primary sigma factor
VAAKRMWSQIGARPRSLIGSLQGRVGLLHIFSNACFVLFLHRYHAMITYKMHKSEMFWHGLLNCSEAKVLSPFEERSLLVELVDCKRQILAARTNTDDEMWDESVAQNEFQQFVRDLAESEVPSLDPEVQALGRLAHKYQEIRAKLALANVRLVAHVAKRYRDRGIPPGDLIQEGFCGLLVAIDRFNVDNESRLATYAIWWIRQAIQRAVAGGAYPVRLNPRQLHQLAQAQRANGAGGFDWERMTRSDPAEPALSPTVERVFAATRPVLSLDAPSRYDGTTTIGEFLVPPDADDSHAEEAYLSVGDLIKSLGPREQLILKLRFGLGGEAPHTLVEVSKVLGVSKERVRQIQNRALNKLRSSPTGADLRGRSEAEVPAPTLSRKRA